MRWGLQGVAGKPGEGVVGFAFAQQRHSAAAGLKSIVRCVVGLVVQGAADGEGEGLCGWLGRSRDAQQQQQLLGMLGHFEAMGLGPGGGDAGVNVIIRCVLRIVVRKGDFKAQRSTRRTGMVVEFGATGAQRIHIPAAEGAGILRSSGVGPRWW